MLYIEILGDVLKPCISVETIFIYYIFFKNVERLSDLSILSNMGSICKINS